MVHHVLLMLSRAALSKVDKEKTARSAVAAASALADRKDHEGLRRAAAIITEVFQPMGPPPQAHRRPDSPGPSAAPAASTESVGTPGLVGSPSPIASKELSTRAWIEMEKVGDFHVTLQVTNVKAALLNVSGPNNYKGYYEITPVPVGVEVALLDDEGDRVPAFRSPVDPPPPGPSGRAHNVRPSAAYRRCQTSHPSTSRP